MKVFVLQHVHTLPEGEEEVKLIGVYSTEEAGHEAIAALSNQPGFADHPEGFHLGAYELNKTFWGEGFVTVRSRDDD